MLIVMLIFQNTLLKHNISQRVHNSALNIDDDFNDVSGSFTHNSYLKRLTCKQIH